MSTLIVLDINGVICNKCNEGIRINDYYSIKPIHGYMDFIDEILSLGYDIAWFSSTHKRNASKILRELHVYDKPSIFKWYGAGNIKDLSLVKKSFPQYKKYIIVDDSYEKIMYNSDDEKIIFEGKYNDVIERIILLAVNEDRTIRYCKE